MADLTEYEKTDSNFSSMRKAFFWMVKLGMWLTGFIAVSAVAAAFINAFLPKEHAMIAIPLGALIGLIGTVFGAAFGGKAAQSFSEPDLPIVKKEPDPTVKK